MLQMRTLLLVTALSATVFAAAPSWAATESQCHANWSKMDTKGNGFIAGRKAKSYIRMMKRAGTQMAAAGRVAESEYMSACIADVFKRGAY